MYRYIVKAYNYKREEWVALIGYNDIVKAESHATRLQSAGLKTDIIDNYSL